MIADYFIIRRQRLEVAELYSTTGRYGTFRWASILVLFLAILPHVPGFLVQIDVLSASSISPFLLGLYNFSWFSGFVIAFILHLSFQKFLYEKPDAL